MKTLYQLNKNIIIELNTSKINNVINLGLYLKQLISNKEFKKEVNTENMLLTLGWIEKKDNEIIITEIGKYAYNLFMNGLYSDLNDLNIR